MKRFGTISVIVVFLSVFAVMSWAQPQKQVQPAKPLTQVQTQPAAELLSIPKVRGPEMTKHLNKQVTVEGFYYDGSVPMILDNFGRVRVNMRMPPESYVAIVGPRPTGLKSGDKVSVTGMLLKPTAADPRYVQKESVMIKLLSADNLRILKRGVYLKTSKFSVQPTLKVSEEIAATLIPQKYAVLIAGGINPFNNHERYWNDLRAMYNVLLSHGYKKGNIKVIYADGSGRDTSMPVDYSATASNIATVFNTLAKKMTDKDVLYIMTDDHGGGYQDRTITESGVVYPAGMQGGVKDADGTVHQTIWLWGSSMTNDAFAAEVNKITHYAEMIIQMGQCFSGGFIKYLTGPRRTIMSAASESEPSWATDDLQYNEFTYWYIAALIGRKPDGSASVNADTNADGRISILEAYNFARSNDKEPETPLFEDDGITPGHSGPMPSGGDGIRSANISPGGADIMKREFSGAKTYTAAVKKSASSATPSAIPNVSGQWKGSNGLVYDIKQTGDRFEWTVKGVNEKAEGVIEGNNISATWQRDLKSDSLKGKITKITATDSHLPPHSTSKATRIDWDDGMRFYR